MFNYSKGITSFILIYNFHVWDVFIMKYNFLFVYMYIYLSIYIYTYKHTKCYSIDIYAPYLPAYRLYALFYTHILRWKSHIVSWISIKIYCKIFWWNVITHVDIRWVATLRCQKIWALFYWNAPSFSNKA